MTPHPPRPHKRSTQLILHFLPISLATVLPFMNPYLRADATWTASNGTWSNPANWSTNPTIPNATDAAVLFDPAAASRNVTVDGNYTTGSLTLNSPAGDALVGGNLTLSASAGNATITVNNLITNGNRGNTINSAVVLSSPTVIVNNYAPVHFNYTLAIGGKVTGNQPLFVTGPGASVFSGDLSALTGPLSISQSYVELGFFVPTVLGSPTLSISNGGTLEVNLDGVVANSSITLNGGTLAMNASTTAAFKPVTVTADSTLHMYFTSSALIPSLNGAANLTIVGKTCTLSGNNTFTGNISLSSGWLSITGSLVHSQISLPTLSTLSLTRPVGTNSATNSVAPGSVVATGGIIAVAANIDFRPALAPNPDLSGIRFDAFNSTLAGSNSLDINAFANPSAVHLGGNGGIASTMNIRPDLATHTFRFGFPQSLTPVSSFSSLSVNSTLSDHDNAPANLDLSGPSTLILGAANTYSGTTSIASNSFLIVGATGAIPVTSPVTNNGNLSASANTTSAVISGNGTLSVAPNITLTLAPNSGASRQSALSLIGSSRFDLSNNPFIIQAPDAATKSTDLTQFASQISTARKGGLWNGLGITSSTVAADPTHLTLVLIDNAVSQFTTYANQPVDTNSILLVPASFGDANLDNKIDLTDLSTLLNHFGQSTPNWTDGNFDHAPTIDLTDLAYVLNNFGQTIPNASASGLLMTDDGLPAPAPASTPEPTTLFLLLPLLLHPRRSTRPTAF